MFRLDYFSCILTVVSTILIGKKEWSGFVVAGINSVLISLIALQTHQIGFIPANAFCILIYVFSIRAWRRDSNVPARVSAGAEEQLLRQP
jgi:hypothetical protein